MSRTIPPRPALLAWQNAPPDLGANLLVNWEFMTRPRVDLWFVPLDEVISKVIFQAGGSPYQRWLSRAERQRSDRFQFEILRQRFIVTRGILRQLIGFYHDQAPEQVNFTYSDRGKPQVVLESGKTPFHFNLSHTPNYALYGFSPCPIGVDLERIGKQRDGLAIAQRFFAPAEQALLTQTPITDQEMTFLRHWVCKEAVLKATGEGLSGNLPATAISFLPQVHLNAPHLAGITIEEITPSLKTIAAVALLQDKISLRSTSVIK